MEKEHGWTAGNGLLRKNRRVPSGFTLIELVITVAILAIIGIAILTSAGPARRVKDLQDTTKKMGAALRDAESRAIDNMDGESWGVHFDNTNSNSPYFAIFSGVYSTSTSLAREVFPIGVTYDASSLGAGQTLDISFSAVNGTPSVSTTIQLDWTSYTSTVSVNSAGLVSY